jgi:hypothetical protein
MYIICDRSFITSTTSGKWSFKAAVEEIGRGDQHVCSSQSGFESAVGADFGPSIDDSVERVKVSCEARRVFEEVMTKLVG